MDEQQHHERLRRGRRIGVLSLVFIALVSVTITGVMIQSVFFPDMGTLDDEFFARRYAGGPATVLATFDTKRPTGNERIDTGWPQEALVWTDEAFGELWSMFSAEPPPAVDFSSGAVWFASVPQGQRCVEPGDAVEVFSPYVAGRDYSDLTPRPVGVDTAVTTLLLGDRQVVECMRRQHAIRPGQQDSTTPHGVAIVRVSGFDQPTAVAFVNVFGQRGIGRLVIDRAETFGLASSVVVTDTVFAQRLERLGQPLQNAIRQASVGMIELGAPLADPLIGWSNTNPRCGVWPSEATGGPGSFAEVRADGPNSGRVAAIWVRGDTSTRTYSGFGVGTSMAELDATYGERLQVWRPSAVDADGLARNELSVTDRTVAALSAGGYAITYFFDEADVVTELKLSGAALAGDQPRCF